MLPEGIVECEAGDDRAAGRVDVEVLVRGRVMVRVDIQVRVRVDIQVLYCRSA